MTAPHVLMTGLVIGESARWHENRLRLSNRGAQRVGRHGRHPIASRSVA